MPKRSAKRPVGRPQKSKIKQSHEGKVFDVDYGAYRLNLHDDSTGNPIKNFDHAFMRLMNYLAESQKQADTIINRLAEDMTTSEVLRSELQECSIMTELLRRLFEKSLRKGIDTGDFREARAIAIAFTAGQLSVIAPHRKHENSYSTGKKMVASAYQGGQRRRLKRPAKSELFSALKKEIAKHGKRTMAVSNVAKHHGVSANTVRTWMKELSITLK